MRRKCARRTGYGGGTSCIFQKSGPPKSYQIDFSEASPQKYLNSSGNIDLSEVENPKVLKFLRKYWYVWGWEPKSIEIPLEILTFPNMGAQGGLGGCHGRSWASKSGPSKGPWGVLTPQVAPKSARTGRLALRILSFRGQQGARARTRPEVDSRHAIFEVDVTQ